MRLLLVRVAVAAATILLATHCAAPGGDGQGSRAGGDAGDLTRFCYALARSMAALEEDGASRLAADAAEEVLARAPGPLRDDARTIAEHVRRALDGEPDALEQASFIDASERLHEDTRDLCDSVE